MNEIMVTISLWTLPLLLAITLHEAGHAYVAYWRGDDTAARAGRLSLNPLAHIDPIGTILIPAALILLGTGFVFGYAKPVPVHVGRLKNLPVDSILVSLAGPGANFVIALVSGLIVVLGLKLGVAKDGWLIGTMQISVKFNCFLGIFNLLPIPPLDGGRIVTDLLPYDMARMFRQLERFGFFIVIGIVILFPGFVSGIAIGAARLVFQLWGGLFS